MPKPWLNACSTNKYFSNLCDESFFRNRIAYKYPLALKNKPESMKWKQFYLKLVYLIGKMKEIYNFDFVSGNPEIYYTILTNNRIDRQFYLASKNNLKDLVYFLAKREVNDWKYSIYLEWGIFGAAIGNHEELVNWYLKSLNNDYLETALSGAAKGGHNLLVKKLIEKGAIDFDHALYNSGLKGHRDTIELILKYGGDINQALIGAADSKLPKKFIDFLIMRGANIEDGILLAENDQETIDYLRNFL